MNIKFNDLEKQYLTIKDNVKDKIEDCLRSGAYIDGSYVREFEKNFCEYTGSKFSIGVSNGTDGLKLAIQTLRKKGKNLVILPANTFIADALAVTHQINQDIYSFYINLVDCDDYYQIDVNKLEETLEKNYRNYDNIIIIAVHLYGHPSDIIEILELRKKYEFYLIEDASQAHGAEIQNKMIGGFGDISVYSLYPGKNLGAAGDAGIITTNNKDYNDSIVSLRNYGSEKKYYYNRVGWNNRMDGLQAIILNEKLKYLEKWNYNRLQAASYYQKYLSDLFEINLPQTAKYCTKNVFHIYCIRVKDRTNLQNYLNDNGITTIIHYPIPIELTEIYSELGFYNSIKTKDWANQIVSLPIHPFISEEEVYYVSDKIKKFYQL